MDALVYLVVWLAKAALKAYRRRQGQAGGQAGAGAPAGAEGGRDPTAASSHPATAPAQVDAAARHASALAGTGRKLAERALAFAGRSARDPAERELRSVAADPIAVTSQQAADAVRRVADRPRELDLIRRRLSFHTQVLSALEQLDGQRADGGRRALLRDIEALAMAFYQPLLDSQNRRGFPLYTRRTVASLGESPGRLAAILAGTTVAPIEVSVRTQVDALAWPLVAREVGRDILLSTDGIFEQVRAAAGYPPPRPPPAPGYLTEDDVIGALGAWQTELCADAIGAVLLGPSYLAALTGMLHSPDQPYRIRMVELRDDGSPAPTPPADLRVTCAAEVLARIGFAAEADRQLAPWREQHPQDLEYFYPTGGGRYAAVPEDLYTQPAQTLAAVVCNHQLQSLAGMHLLDVPGLHHSLDRERRVERTVDQILAGRVPTSDDPRVIVSACALAAQHKPELRNALIPTLRGAIVGGPEDQQTAAPTRASHVREGLFDPAVLRDAIALSDVFERKSAVR